MKEADKRIVIVATRNQLWRLHNIIAAALNSDSDRQTVTFPATAEWPELVIIKHDLNLRVAAVSVGVKQ